MTPLSAHGILSLSVLEIVPGQGSLSQKAHTYQAWVVQSSDM